MKNKLLKLRDLCFIVSIPFITLLLVGNCYTYYVRSLVIGSFLLGIFIRFKVIRNISINKYYLLFSIFFSLYVIGQLSTYTYTGPIFIQEVLNSSIKIDTLKSIIMFLSIYSFTSIVYFLINLIMPFIKKEIRKISKVELIFLLIMISVAFISTSVIYNKTNVFYLPVYKNIQNADYDVIYTSDSGYLNATNAYLNVSNYENDLRQPLFGLFSIPFSVTAKFISNFMPFLPNNYYIIFNTIQIFLLSISLIFISRMMRLKDNGKILFYTMSIVSYPFILFSFLSEQYVVAVFYLILSIYLSLNYKPKINYCYIGAVGTLLTSGIIFPLITKFKNIKDWIINVFKCFIAFAFTSFLSGQIVLFYDLGERIKYLMTFSGKNLQFIDKLKQFTYFVESIFIAPKGYEIFGKYKLIPINTISVIGIIILLICLISFIINRKNKMATVSILWVIFSIFILCILGWGTAENGLILYSLYFSWAYIVLICLFINKLIKNNRTRIIIYIILFTVMLTSNISEFSRILEFGLINYPC